MEMVMQEDEDNQFTDEFDTPWKDILVPYIKDFLAFFLLEAHDGIDWEQGFEFLDKELSRIIREAQIGDRVMDKLVKVWRRDGAELWVLIHIEIQGDRKSNFAERMYVYQYRAYDLYHVPVVGLAVLADDESGWRPTEYQYELWGTKQSYRFTAVKLIDHPVTELEESTNPFAMVTLAHIQAKQTRHRPEERYQAKRRLIRRLYEQGYDRQQVIDLFRFIDWVLHLPNALDDQLVMEIIEFEESQKMPYISSVERFGEERGRLMGIQIGRQEGRQEGRQDGKTDTLLKQMRRKFGQTPDWVTEKVKAANLEQIEVWSDNFVFATSVDEVFGDRH
ncbi:MAG: hypothetical protein HQM01_04260 [Magnetococcales bacterium]|nr:hypothetical protein [Magnetococcales bacterium]